MSVNNIRILSTRTLRPETIAEAAVAGLTIEQVPFIETVPINNETLKRQVNAIADKYSGIIFTSSNAVEAVMNMVGKKEMEWKFYCTAPQTKNKLLQYFSEDRIAGTAPNATELAGFIAAERPATPLVFFCGQQAREDLPAILEKEKIDLRKLVVYDTRFTPVKTTGDFEGILFFSPSAVESYFQLNKSTAGTVMFAIGETTAAALREKTENEIMVADHPSEASMLKKVSEWFAGGK